MLVQKYFFKSGFNFSYCERLKIFYYSLNMDDLIIQYNHNIIVVNILHQVEVKVARSNVFWPYLCDERNPVRTRPNIRNYYFLNLKK